MMQGGVQVRLPRAEARPLQEQTGITVSVDRRGRIFVDQAAFSYDDFRATFRALVARRKPAAIYLGPTAACRTATWCASWRSSAPRGFATSAWSPSRSPWGREGLAGAGRPGAAAGAGLAGSAALHALVVVTFLVAGAGRHRPPLPPFYRVNARGAARRAGRGRRHSGAGPSPRAQRPEAGAPSRRNPQSRVPIPRAVPRARRAARETRGAEATTGRRGPDTPTPTPRHLPPRHPAGRRSRRHARRHRRRDASRPRGSNSPSRGIYRTW